MRYLVISYDTDEQRAYFDWAEAEDQESAEAIAGERRDYAIPVTGFTVKKLRDLADAMEAAKEEDVWKEREDPTPNDHRHDCICADCSGAELTADTTRRTTYAKHHRQSDRKQ